MGFMQLLGFRPLREIRYEDSVFHSYLLRPIDKLRPGSAVLFSSLLNSLHKQNVAAIVRWVPDKRGLVLSAALMPHVGVEGELPGINMVRLPFKHERRIVNPTGGAHHSAPAASIKSDVQLARAVINSIMLQDFHPLCVKNPTVQQHFAGIEALALGEESPYKPVDDLQQEEAAFDKALPAMMAWHKSIYHTSRMVIDRKQAAVEKRLLEEERRVDHVVSKQRKLNKPTDASLRVRLHPAVGATAAAVASCLFLCRRTSVRIR
eukprot:GHVS01057959.1.p1 GENE.GHVS01057959.1~~GHVS01057959.1.p1  ORF type:complete len:263 (-),score=40.09 GHVS01057959.1:329-1117(-)